MRAGGSKIISNAEHEMKQILISAVVAAVVAALAAVATLHLHEHMAFTSDDNAAAAVSRAPFALSVTEELLEDSWVDGARTAGADNKPLASADNSICFLTKVELKGVQGPADANSCRIAIDDFTGFWEVIAEVEEGGQSEIRCNARCLVWQ
jgi:hypothetical protein